MHSIRAKIVALTMTAILMSSLAFLSVFFTTVAKENSSLSARQMNLITQNLQKSLDSYLDSIDQSVDMAANIAVDSLDTLALVEGGVIGAGAQEEKTWLQQQELAQYLGEHCDHVQDAFYSVANHTNGVVSYYYCINPAVSELEHGFFYTKLGKAGFEKQPPLDARSFNPRDLEHYAWYYLPIQRGRPSWVGPYLASFVDGMNTLSYLTPIYKSGVLIGVLGMDIPFETLVRQVSAVQVYDTGFAFLLDENDRILYHPALEAGTVPEKAAALLQEADFHRSSSDAPLRYDKLGETWQLSYATLSSGMKLVVTAPVSEINSSFTRMTANTFWVTLALLLVFSLPLLLLIRAVTKPLQVLSSAAQRLSAGDYDVALDYEGKDEVGTLTATFRQMRDHLKLYISDLNSRAYTDALTGAKSKGAFVIFLGRLDDAVLRMESEEPLYFAIIMFDCNGLKHINDVYGHQKGDLYLINACEVVSRAFLHSPVFRIGGDEFVVLLERKDYEAREELLQQLDEAIRAHNDAAAEPWERVDLAKGMAEFLPGRDFSTHQVFRRADEAMYEDKKRTGAARR